MGEVVQFPVKPMAQAPRAVEELWAATVMDGICFMLQINTMQAEQAAARAKESARLAREYAERQRLEYARLTAHST